MLAGEPYDAWPLGIYIIAVPLAFANTWLAIACYIIVALIWLMPEKKLEELMEDIETN